MYGEGRKMLNSSIENEFTQNEITQKLILHTYAVDKELKIQLKKVYFK